MYSHDLCLYSLLWLAISHAACQQQCHEYVLISARGTSEPQGSSAQFEGMINDTLSRVVDGIEYDVVYPASNDLIPSAVQGGQEIKRYINAGVESCPDQQYAILGYSQGAAAAALGLQNITNADSAAYKAIKAILVLGNPGHVSGASSNVDQLGGRTTQNYTGLFYYNGSGALPDIYYRAGDILDICYQKDPICAPGYPNASFLPNHVLYGSTDKVQQMAADFLVSRLSRNATAATSPPQGAAATFPLPALVKLVTILAIACGMFALW